MEAGLCPTEHSDSYIMDSAKQIVGLGKDEAAADKRKSLLTHIAAPLQLFPISMAENRGRFLFYHVKLELAVRSGASQEDHLALALLRARWHAEQLPHLKGRKPVPEYTKKLIGKSSSEKGLTFS